MKTSFTISAHALRRASQRGITEKMMRKAIRFGEAFQKQGCVFHVISKKALRMHFFNIGGDSLEGLTVITRDFEVQTCYKNKNARTHIKKKPKRSRVPQRKVYYPAYEYVGSLAG